MYRCLIIAFVGLVVSCDEPDSTPTAAGSQPVHSDAFVAPAEPVSTPLPDCAGVETSAPTIPKPGPWLAKARREPADTRLVARVGETEIPRTASDAVIALKVEKYVSRGRQPPPEVADRYLATITGRLVEQEILRQEAVARGITDDPAALARSSSAQRVGLPDYDRHLQVRGETEASVRDMALAGLRELAILEAEAPAEIDDARLTAYYCRTRDRWPADREYRVISYLAFGNKSAAEAALAVLERGSDIARIASDNPGVAWFAHEIVAGADNDFFRAVFAAPVGRGTVVEAGSFAYVVVVERSLAPGTLSKELVFEALREDVRIEELGKRRAELRARLVAKYPVTVFGVSDIADSND